MADGDFLKSFNNWLLSENHNNAELIYSEYTGKAWKKYASDGWKVI